MKTFPLKYNKMQEYKEYFNPKDWIEFVLGEINPMFSTSKVKGRILSIHLETETARTFTIETNRKISFKAGQYIPVTVEVNGRRLTRYYSISSAPSEGLLQITIKRQKDGLVSNFMHDHLSLGSVIELGEAKGEFVLTENLPEKLLLIAGGSGITPIYSILKTLSKMGYTGEATLLYFSRSKEDVIFHEAIQNLEKNNSFLKTHFILTDIESNGFQFGFLSEKMLKTLVPDFELRTTYLCGPKSLQDSVKDLLPKDKIISENFQPFLKSSAKRHLKDVSVTLTKSHRTILVKGEKNLLEELEDNGIYPQSGCRMGICHTCACTKKTGTVTNLQEGTVSENKDETIQLCLSRAEENLELDL